MASPTFWADQTELLFEILYPQILDAISDGLLSGADLLGAEIGLDWEMVNVWAVDFAKNYTYELVHDITDYTMGVLRDKINVWTASGAPLDDLISELASTGLYDEYRAFMIATTEVTRAYGEGNLEIWKRSGVVKEVQWMTAKDEIVCDICGALDGTIVPLGKEGFEGYSPNADVTNMVDCPPAHVNCRCWMRPIWG